MKILSFSSKIWYDTVISPDGYGSFDIAPPSLSVPLVGDGPEGVAYVPGGSPGFDLPSILLAEFSAGRISAYEVDGNGDPNTVPLGETSSPDWMALKEPPLTR